MTATPAAATHPAERLSAPAPPGATRGRPDDVDIRIADDIETFAAFWPTSADLGVARGHVFQCADVLRVWCETMGVARGTQPCLAAVLDPNGSPLMLLPLGIERRGRTRVLTFLDGDVSDYNAPILFPSEWTWDAGAVGLLWRKLIERLPPFDVAILDKMPAEVGGLPNPLLRLGTTPYPVSGHATALSGTWEAFSSTRLPRRQDSRRKLRKLEKLGPVAFSAARAPDEVEAYLEAMIRQKTRRFAETRSEGFAAPGKLDYFRAGARRLGLPGPVRLFAMTVGDVIVATHWGMVAGGRFYHMMPGYEAGAWRAFSPGKFLNDHLIGWSFEHGLEHFDFGVGDEDYKREVCDTVIPLARVVRAVTLRGRLHLAATAAKAALRRTGAWQRLRDLKWRLIEARRPGAT